MKLSNFIDFLSQVNTLKFKLPNGDFVPLHFHITEIGIIDKKYIDCGGTVRNEKKISFQLWEANDFEHRLTPKKLLAIIEKAKSQIEITDETVEIEYQNDTIGKYELGFDGEYFLLINTLTDCLAKDKCGIPEEKLKVNLSELNKTKENNCCTPGSGCC
ncbi:MAG: DUF6428 family protein [Vicingaceae bacterium]